MKKKLDIGAVIALMLCVATVTALMTQWQITNHYNQQLEATNRVEREIAKFKEAKAYIEKAYVGSWDEEKLLDGATSGMVQSLGDRWSSYLNVEDFQTYLNSSDNQFVGIGVSATYHEESRGIQVTEVYPKSPAFEAGIQPMDIIVAVDGTKVADQDYYVARDNIGGAENTMVALEVYRPSTKVTLNLEIYRRKVQIESVRSQILDGNIGLVRIRNFDTGTDLAFVEAVKNLQAANVSGIIFDVRSNPGGALKVMLPMLDMLLPEGTLITLREKSGNEEVFTSNAEQINLPMCVVVNENSYSAAEFFAAALREYQKAEIVGQPTSGKGYAQVPIKLSDGSGIILSTNEYFTPSGKSLADVGLTPDYLVSLTEEQARQTHVLAPEEDAQLLKAIEVISRQITTSDEQ